MDSVKKLSRKYERLLRLLTIGDDVLTTKPSLSC